MQSDAGKETRCVLDWTIVTPTPDAETYIPQGLASDENGLIFTAYTKEEHPLVKLYRFANGEWKELKGDIGPLVHTSGIVAYMELYFLIDYESGLIALANIGKENFKIDTIVTSSRKNISSAFIYRENDQDYLIVSLFSLFGSYEVYEIKATKDDTFKLNYIKNFDATSFIQGNLGLENGTFLEASNQIGPDRITLNKLTPGFMNTRIATWKFPGRLIEDLAIHDGYLYTTDEGDFSLYRTPFNPSCYS